MDGRNCFRPIGFFRRRLMDCISSPLETLDLFQKLEKESNALEEEILNLAYYSKNIDIDYIWDLTGEERSRLANNINENRKKEPQQ